MLSAAIHAAAIGAGVAVWRTVADLTSERDEPTFFEVIPVEAQASEAADETPDDAKGEVAAALDERPIAVPQFRSLEVPKFNPRTAELLSAVAKSDDGIADLPNLVAEFDVADSLVPPQPRLLESPQIQNAAAPSTRTSESSASFPPTAKGTIKPEYPPSAKKRGKTGRVTIEMCVGADGKLERAEVAASSGHAALDRAALKAVRDAEFTPGTKDGTPVRATARLTFDFRLK